MSKYPMVRLEDVCDKATSSIAQKDLKNLEGIYPIYGAGGFIKNVNFYKQDREYIAIVKDGAGIGRAMILPAFSSVIGTMQYILPKDNIITKYLYFAIDSMNLAKYFTGATIPHIYFKDYKNESLPLPPIEHQRSIIKILESIVSLIIKRKQQLSKFDELAKSRFIEMFGQCGEDRFGWGVSKLGDYCIINPSKSTEARLEDELEVSFCPMPYVSESGDIKTDETKLYKDVKSGFTYFAEDDVLFAKITPCMENGKGAIARNLKNGIGFGSTEFHILRPNRSIITPEWLYVLTTFKQFRKDAEANMTGSAGQKRVPSIFLRNYKISIPPLEFQKQYVGILEQLDKSKFRIKKSLEKLEMTYKALLQEYFG